MYFAQRSLLYPGATQGEVVEAVAKSPWGEWVEIVTPDGETLAGLHTEPAPGRPTVLLFPGNADNIAAYAFLADGLGKQGLGLLAVSYRGYPGSTGSPTESGLLADGLASFDWLNTKYSSNPIVVMGRSLGTGVATNTAAERPAAGLILVSAYDSVLAIAQRKYPFLPVGLLIKDSYRSDLRIENVSAPKFFLHGELDQVIPLDNGRRLFAAAPEPKQFVVQAGLHHHDIWTPQLMEAVVSFAGAAVRPGP